MNKRCSRKSGQTMVEYIIIVVIVAIAAIAIVGVFGDTIKEKFGGAVTELGGDSQATDDALNSKGTAQDQFKKLGEGTVDR
jgi:Flp pilus assembly pilin Flp